MKVIKMDEFLNEGFTYINKNEYMISHILEDNNFYLHILPKSSNTLTKEEQVEDIYKYLDTISGIFGQIFSHYTENDDWAGIVLKLEYDILLNIIKG